MADFAYLRVSTDKQDHDPQAHAIAARYPNATVVTETASGGKNRPILRELLQQLQSGDRLIVASLDRLGRSTLDVISKIEAMTTKGVVLISLREGVDYSTPAGRLVTQVLVSVAELERSLVSERTKAALAAARARGTQLGAPRRINAAVRARIAAHYSAGMSYSAIGRELGIHRATVQRILTAAE